MENWEPIPFLTVLFSWFIKTSVIILAIYVVFFLLLQDSASFPFSLSLVQTWFDKTQFHRYVFEQKIETKDVNFV